MNLFANSASAAKDESLPESASSKTSESSASRLLSPQEKDIIFLSTRRMVVLWGGIICIALGSFICGLVFGMYLENCALEKIHNAQSALIKQIEHALPSQSSESKTAIENIISDQHTQLHEEKSTSEKNRIYEIHLGVFRRRADAEDLAKSLKLNTPAEIVSSRNGEKTTYLVKAGQFDNWDQACDISDQIALENCITASVVEQRPTRN